MRSIDSWLDRFAYRHPRFGIPNLIRWILIGNVIVYILDLCSSGAASALLGLDFASILQLELWRLFTFPFVPQSAKPIWFVVSLFFYYFLGTTMEREWGTAKFSLFYLCGAALTFLASIVTYVWTLLAWNGGESLFLGLGGLSMSVTLDAVHSTLFLAFATLFPDAQIRVYFVLPVKAKWLAAFYVFMQVWNIVDLGRVFLPIFLPILLPALLASWINYLIFFWTPVKAAVNRVLRRTRHQTSAQTLNFKAAQKKAKETKGYMHKCAVCGRTDADDPSLEFRYCSKCDGYYCYCMDHINDHVHVRKED